MAQNLIEKIVQNHAVNVSGKVHSGDTVSIRPGHVMTHDNTGAVIPKFRAIGAERMADPRQPVFALDHNVQDTSTKNLTKYRMIADFAAETGVDFYPAGRGIGHQIMCEEGYAFPGTMMVASDSHSNMYGGLGCLGTPVVRTDAAALWATGRTWWEIPPVAKITLTGRLKPGVSGKDVILMLCGLFNQDEVLNHALEFAGSGLSGLSVDDRLAIANMTTEWGALAGLFPIDAVTVEWIRNRVAFLKKRGPAGVPSDEGTAHAHPRLNDETLSALTQLNLRPDPDAFYAKEVTLDLSTVIPGVSGPHNVKTYHTATGIQSRKIKINKAYLVSCVNSRVEDLAAAASIVRGKKVADGVEFYIAAASDEVQAASIKRGDWQALLDAGAIALPPGCGPCIGLGAGLLQDGEVGISATNRNFRGRMGSKKAEAYLASPAVVASSALAGFITGPDDETDIKADAALMVNTDDAPESAAGLMTGFPESSEGRIVFCPADNMNTDGIYPGKYTYNDAMTPDDQAGVVMENYDPEFKELIHKGDILVGGFNFGTGSSREQAATALKYAGIAMVIAGSFSQTYKRNAVNNGFMVVESPGLVRYLHRLYGNEKLTAVTDRNASIDWKNGKVSVCGESFAVRTPGHAAQELILKGGLNNWVREQLKS